jgi:hypothetical protein
LGVIVSTMLDPLRPIEVAVGHGRPHRTGADLGALQTESKPIRNPVTGAGIALR